MPGSRLPFAGMAIPQAIRLDPALDARLVERCRAGDARAWGELVRRHERLVYAIGRSYRLSDDDQADLFQDVFSALVRSLPRLRETRTLVRWLAVTSDRIARATALRRRREQALSEPDSGPALAGLADPDAGVEASLERLEAQATVRLALESLAPRCRDLLRALYQEDPTPSYAAISRRLGVPVGSLGPTRARCMERLRAGLDALAPRAGRIRERAAPTSEAEERPDDDSTRPPRRTEETS
jgi:RNA polymerase sigma factor (sigma-70 family)